MDQNFEDVTKSKHTGPESVITSKSKTPKKKLTEDDILNQKHQVYKDSMHVMKQIYKDMDPAIIRNENDIRGDLKTSIKIISTQNLILIKVISAKDLHASEVRGRSFRPFVKVELLLKNTIIQDSKTAVSKSRNPVFNEIFPFDLQLADVDSAKIRFRIYSSDGSADGDFLGELILRVSDLKCIDNPKTAWYKLQPEIDLSIGGEVRLGINYKLPRTLSVTVHHLLGITPPSPKSKLYTRLYIPGVPDVYKTWPIDISSPLVWNETYEFNIPKEELESRTVIVVVLDAANDDGYLGECHINLNEFNIMRGYLKNFPLADMRGSHVVRSRWAQNAITQELQEAMLAHAIYMRPNFLFDLNSDYTKTISVNVPKAGAHARRRVVNGIIIR